MPVKQCICSAPKREIRRTQQKQKEEEAVSRGHDAGACKCSHYYRKKRSPGKTRLDKKEQKVEKGITWLAAEETMLMHVTQSVEEKHQ